MDTVAESPTQILMEERKLEIMREAVGVTPEELRKLDTVQYSAKFRVIANTDPEIIHEFADVIVDKFIFELSEHGSSSKELFDDAFEIGNNTRLAFWMLTHGDEGLSPELMEKAYNLHSC